MGHRIAYFKKAHYSIHLMNHETLYKFRGISEKKYHNQPIYHLISNILLSDENVVIPEEVTLEEPCTCMYTISDYLLDVKKNIPMDERRIPHYREKP